MDIPQQFEVQTIIWEVLCSTKISLRCRTSPKKSYVFKLVELFLFFYEHLSMDGAIILDVWCDQLDELKAAIS